jgi:hypothetical protein
MALKMKYFVLKPKAKGPQDAHAIASQAAMEIYAVAIRGTDPKLADELTRWAARERKRAAKAESKPVFRRAE